VVLGLGVRRVRVRLVWGGGGENQDILILFLFKKQNQKSNHTNLKCMTGRRARRALLRTTENSKKILYVNDICNVKRYTQTYLNLDLKNVVTRSLKSTQVQQ